MASRFSVAKRKTVLTGFRKNVLEILKWIAVVWCLWPLARISEKGIPLTRVVAGILFFVLFSGKLLYDTIITDYVRQRRTTLKQDIAALAGMVFGILLLIGLVLAMVAALLLESAKSSQTPMQ
jgi:hypothetical protein